MRTNRLRNAMLISASLALMAAVSSCTGNPERQPPPVATIEEPRPIPGDRSEFLGETYPDATEIKVSEIFTKTWDLRNAGTISWKDRYVVRQSTTGGCTSEPKVRMADTDPGKTVTIAVRVTAPPNPAVCHVKWKVTDAQGRPYFPKLAGVWLDVKVVR